MNFQDKIKDIRHQLNMSQKDFAVEVGLSQQAIAHYEVGDRTPTYKNLILLNEFLKKKKIKISLT